MLNFEDEMKAVKKGYVVLSLDEYDSLRDQIAAANMKAYEAEQLANRRIAELISVEKRTYGGQEIDIKFNTRAISTLAVEMLHATFSDEELADYEIKTADNMLLLDEPIAIHKANIPTEDE